MLVGLVQLPAKRPLVPRRLTGFVPFANRTPRLVGRHIEAQHKNDLMAEQGAVKAYNEGISVAVEVGDNGSRELLEATLKDEEEHLDWLEAQLEQIGQMGMQNYLVEQVS